MLGQFFWIAEQHLLCVGGSGIDSALHGESINLSVLHAHEGFRGKNQEHILEQKFVLGLG